jgi:hypothetical protein
VHWPTGAPYSASPHALVSDFVPLSEQHFEDEHAIDRISVRPVNIRHSADPVVRPRGDSGRSVRFVESVTAARSVALCCEIDTITLMSQREEQRQAKLAAEAEWVWPTLCIGTLWGLGLLLNFVWLRTWLGVGLLGLCAVVMAIVFRVRRSALSAVWAGGAVFFGLGLCWWLLLVAFFRFY